jgi:hypothetical protein
MNLNLEQFPTYKSLFPVQTTQTTSSRRASQKARIGLHVNDNPTGNKMDAYASLAFEAASMVKTSNGLTPVLFSEPGIGLIQKEHHILFIR